MKINLGIIAASIKKTTDNIMTLVTTSALASWSPLQIINSGTTLIWDATGAVVDNIVADDPTFDLSSSGGGDTNMSVESMFGVTRIRFNVNINIKEIDLSQTLKLDYFEITNNELTSLDIANNVLLNYLKCSGNDITSLDVSNNLLLATLFCDGNDLASLDVSNNVALTNLNCGSNLLTSLILGGGALTTLTASGNLLTSINTSSEPNLASLSCISMASLTSVVLGGGAITSLTVWGNANLTSLDFSSEPNITSLIAMACGLTNGITNMATATGLKNNIWVYQNNYTVTATNQLLADLVANGQTNGVLKYRNNETGQGVTDRATLVSRGWTITNYAT